MSYSSSTSVPIFSFDFVLFGFNFVFFGFDCVCFCFIVFCFVCSLVPVDWLSWDVCDGPGRGSASSCDVSWHVVCCWGSAVFGYMDNASKKFGVGSVSSAKDIKFVMFDMRREWATISEPCVYSCVCVCVCGCVCVCVCGCDCVCLCRCLCLCMCYRVGVGLEFEA